jgi:hypothetical protein
MFSSPIPLRAAIELLNAQSANRALMQREAPFFAASLLLDGINAEQLLKGLRVKGLRVKASNGLKHQSIFR